LFVNIVIYAYFIYISQSSVQTHLWCGGICNNHVIANCLQKCAGEKNCENRSIIGKGMDKSKVPCLFGHPVHGIRIAVKYQTHFDEQLIQTRVTW